jgi:hypothetical protein
LVNYAPVNETATLQAFCGTYSDCIEGNASQDAILGDIGKFDAEVEFYLVSLTFPELLELEEMAMTLFLDRRFFFLR